MRPTQIHAAEPHPMGRTLSVKTARPCSRQCEPAFDLDQKQISRCVFTSARPGECRRKRFRSTNMTTLKTLTIVAALLAGGTSLAIAQNGPATGGQSPVAGGANGGSRVVAGMLVVRL